MAKQENVEEVSTYDPASCYFPAETLTTFQDGREPSLSGPVDRLGFLCCPGLDGLIFQGIDWDKKAQDGIMVAVTWASNWLSNDRVWRWLTRAAAAGEAAWRRRTLWQGGKEGLVLHITDCGHGREGDSWAVAAALALICAATRRPPLPGVAMTGSLDLQGNLMKVAGMRGKLLGCKAQDPPLDFIIMPQVTHQDVRETPPGDEVADLARSDVCRGFSCMEEVVCAALEGCPPLPLGGLADEKHTRMVGLAYAPTRLLCRDDQPYDKPVIVQASLVRAGGGKGGSSLIVTGHGAEQGEALVARVRSFVLGYCGQIVPPFWYILKDKKVHVTVVDDNGTLDRARLMDLHYNFGSTSGAAYLKDFGRRQLVIRASCSAIAEVVPLDVGRMFK